MNQRLPSEPLLHIVLVSPEWRITPGSKFAMTWRPPGSGDTTTLFKLFISTVAPSARR